MATVSVTGSSLGSPLQNLLLCEAIEPGSAPGYETCKVIYLYHPLGQKIAESPIRMAQSMPREIAVPDGPEEDAKKAFVEEWDRIGADNTICNVATQARVYGIASLAALEKGVPFDKPLDLKKIADQELAFNALDPLNTAGSLVLNQDPNALDFQKHRDISVNGIRYHRSRTVTLMNENPIYIAYTSSAFGYVGRSVYQRALFPLKTFVQTMIADDMVARKVGLIVAALKFMGSIVDSVMAAAASFKRRVLQLGSTDNVLSINEGEKIESLDLKNLEGPLQIARKDSLENIATATPMPAKLLNNETFAEGFGEGSEDAKHVAEYVDGIRAWMRPLYVFMDAIVQRRAWNERFFEAMQRKFPEQYGKMEYEEAFYRWVNCFQASWPSLLREPESELVKVDETKFKTIIAVGQIFLPEVDPENRAKTLQWIADNLNASKRMFSSPLVLDWEALASYTPPQPQTLEEPKPEHPFSAADEATGNQATRMKEIERLMATDGGTILRLARTTPQ